MTKRARALVGLVLVQLVFVAGAQAVTVGDGQSIQTAVTAASPGDTIDVEGNHDERVNVTKALTLRGSGTATVGDTNGAFVVTASNVTIQGFVTDGTTAIDVGAALTGVSVTGNAITGSTTGLAVAGATPVQAHFNRFAGNTTAISGAATVAAANNWFGCNGGPGTTGCDSVSGGVTATPYLRLSLSTSTNAVNPGGTLSVSASLRSNSAGTDLGAIPLSIAGVGFSATRGTIPARATLAEGLASATFTAGDAPGTAQVSAALDNASLSADIQILRPDSDGDGIADDVDCNPTDASKPAKGVADVDCDGQADPAPPAPPTSPGGTTIKLVLNTLTGTSGADKITGTDAAELLLGLAGDDRLRGGKGNDRVFGGAGQDRVYGDAGDDRVNGGGGDDRVEGGTGNDVLEGSSGRDKLVGGAGNDLIVGGTGADAITAHGGDDTARGGSGNDRIDTRDKKRGDIVSCGAGNDRAIVDRGDVVAGDCEHVSRR